MTRPNKKIVRIAINGVTLCASLLIIAILSGFITMPGVKLADEVPGGPDKKIVNLDGLLKRVLELNNRKEHKKALDLLIAALDGKKEDSLLRSLLLQTFDMFLEDEVRLGQRAISKDPLNEEPYLRVSSALSLMGDNFKSMEVLLNGVSKIQNSPKIWMNIAKLELKAERPMEALDLFKEVIRLDPKNSDAYNNAAFILSQAVVSNPADLLAAENFATNARAMDPKNPEYIDTLAEVQFRKGNAKMAQTLIKEAIKLAPEKEVFEDKLRKFSAEVPVKSP